VLDEAGDVLLEQRLGTTPKAMKEVFGKMPRSRIALKTGMHSPWESRGLSELGHEVIVAHARNVRLIGESRRKDDRVDARTVWSGQRSATLGAEAGGARGEEWKETNGDCDRTKAGGVAASLVGEWRGLRTTAQQPSGAIAGGRIVQVHGSEAPRPAPSSGDCVNGLAQLPSRDGREVDNQVAAPAATRTPNLHRANKNAHRRVRMEGWRQGWLGRKARTEEKQKIGSECPFPS
jgi:hypothetical protein